MKTDEFNVLIEETLELIRETLIFKAKEYAMEGDRLHNFKIAARLKKESPKKALWGIAVKHLVSIEDLVEGRLKNTEEMVEEKCGDMINYLLLLMALLKEEREEQ